ncbi:succinylglutamate desuccinylase/aspartoacylase family protein [candidate division KSB1 bacterium]|nr:succinylglutamate desuccinylase/aspartoacylase family protein [candidate division KSB1 bacterium]
MNSTLHIIGEEISPGEKKELRLKISEFYTSNPVYIPVIALHGEQEGPVVFVTAAIHGDEINGIEIVRQLTARIKPSELSGTLLCIPIVNIFGFYTMTRNTPDRRNLNNSFPGINKGSPASRIAYIIFEEIIKRCDFGIDIHTPRENRYEIPHINADLNNRDVHRLARAFGTTIIINTPGPKKSLQHAANKEDIPTIVFSGGEVLRFDKKITESGVNGLMNVLSSLEMVDIERKEPSFSIIVKKNRSVQTTQGGILYVHVQAGDLVYEGELLAKVANPFGEEIETIVAPQNGLIISHSTNPLVNPGNEVCSYVMLDRSLEIAEKALKNR